MRAKSDDTTVGSGQKQPLKAAGARRTTGTTPETPEGGAASRTEFQRKKVVGVRYDVSWIEYQALTAKGDGRDTTAYLVADPAAKPYLEKDVIDSLRAIGQLEGILGIGSFDTRTVYELVFKNKLDQRVFTKRREVTIKGHPADVFNPDNRIIKGKLHWLTLMTRNEDVAETFKKFGKMLQIRRQRIEGQGGPWHSNTLEFEMELNDGTKMEDIPAKIKVGTWTALVLIQGQPAMCFRCKKRGHIRAECRGTVQQQEEEDEAEGSDGGSDSEDSVDETDTVALTPTLAERQAQIKEKKRRKNERRRRRAMSKTGSGQQDPPMEEDQPGNELPEKEAEGSDGGSVSEDITVKELDTVAETPEPTTRPENQKTQQQEATRKRKGQQDPSAAGTQPCDEQEKEEMEIEQDAQNSNNEEEPKEKRPCVDSHSKIGEEEPAAVTPIATPAKKTLPAGNKEKPLSGHTEKDEKKEAEMRLPGMESNRNRDSDAESLSCIDFTQAEIDFSLERRPDKTFEKLRKITKTGSRRNKKGDMLFSREEASFVDEQLTYREICNFLESYDKDHYKVNFNEHGQVIQNTSRWRYMLHINGFNGNEGNLMDEVSKRLTAATTAGQGIIDNLCLWDFVVRGHLVAFRLRDYKDK